MERLSGSRRHLSRTLSEAPQTPLIHSNSFHISLLRVPQRSSQSLLRRLPKRHSESSLHLANLLCRNGFRGMPAAKMDGFLCMIPETPGRLPGACQEVYGEIVVFAQAPLQNALRGSSDIAHPLHWSLTSRPAEALLRRLPKRPSKASQSPLHIPLIHCAATVPRIRPCGNGTTACRPGMPDRLLVAHPVVREKMCVGACGCARGVSGKWVRCLGLRQRV